jgi:hypothetical protein
MPKKRICHVRINSFLVRLSLFSSILLFLSMGAACQASGEGIDKVEERSYGFFSSRSDHVNELLENGFVGKASILWNREQNYFNASEKQKDKECSQALSVALLKSLNPRITSQCELGDAMVGPLPMSSFFSFRQNCIIL